MAKHLRGNAALPFQPFPVSAPGVYWWTAEVDARAWVTCGHTADLPRAHAHGLCRVLP